MGAEDPNKLKAIVIGTGFAGAVTACRLVEAGFDVCVLERGAYRVRVSAVRR